MNEIGGEICRGTAADCPGGDGVLGFASIKPHSAWVNSGRAALLLALKTLIKTHAVRRIWLPTFICPSVHESCIEAGLDIMNYAVNTKLETINESVTFLDNDVFLWVHYFGFLNTSNIGVVAGHNIHIIEDAVQSGFTGGVGGFGQFVFNSMRKFTSAPDGAMLASDRQLRGLLKEPDLVYVTKRMRAKELRVEAPERLIFLDLISQTEAMLSQDLTARKISDIARNILADINVAELARKRRENFARMQDWLSRQFVVMPIFSELQDQSVPLGLPVLAPRKEMRNIFRERLSSAGIYCPIHWVDLPPQKINHLGDQSFSLSDRSLTIPIDQRYTAKDMDYCGRKILAICSELEGFALEE